VEACGTAAAGRRRNCRRAKQFCASRAKHLEDRLAGWLNCGALGPDFELILDSFPRQVPIFPLAEVVLFPGAVLPLHIF
jgi:hypothetical protein